MSNSRITHSDLVKLLPRLVSGTTFVGLTTRTVVDLPKKNPLHGLVKEATRNVQVGGDYEAAVNRRAEKEGLDADRVAKPRKWGTVTPDRLFVEHKGHYYLRARLLAISGPDESLPQYSLNGVKLPHNLVCSMAHAFLGHTPAMDGTKTFHSAIKVLEEYYPKAPEALVELAKKTGLITFTSMPKKQVSSTQEGLEKPVICNDIDFDNIISLSINGMKWDLVADDSPIIPATITPTAPAAPVVAPAVDVTIEDVELA